MPAIAVVTAHGRRVLTSHPDERLLDVLEKNGVPWSATSIYGRREGDTALRLFSGLGEKVSSLGGYSDILIYFNRNVNPFLFRLSEIQPRASDPAAEHSTEYIYRDIDNGAGTVNNYLVPLSPDECRGIVADRVREVITAHVPAGSSVVVGVSGGGDSNAMLYGLSKVAELGIKVHPVIVMGIPDWDAGVPRARELCSRYGLDLLVLTEADVREMMGIPHDTVSLVDRFEREFKGDDFEFLGTLIIRIALSSHAKSIGTNLICTGLNLEDVVCEQFFRLSHGLPAVSMPARAIGDATLLMPLWMCPKRIIDGCFPKYSLDNYEARYPCFSMGRNLYYSVVYNMQSSFPGYIEGLASGWSKIAERIRSNTATTPASASTSSASCPCR